MSSGRSETQSEAIDRGVDLTPDELEGAVTRRSMLRRGAAGGVALSATGLLGAMAAEAAHATGGSGGSGPFPEPKGLTKPLEIFRIATIAEQLAVTFYSNGVQNAGALGLDGLDLRTIKAAGIEEQIHQQFFRSVIALLTGKPAPRTVGPTEFSFPFPNTFTDLGTFIATQQALEGVFDSAFLAAVRELSRQGLHRAAQIAAQIATIESEHRALGRYIAARNGIDALPDPVPGLLGVELDGLAFFDIDDNFPPNPVPTSPPDNWAFSPVFLKTVGDAPALVQKAGFLSPKSGNRFRYHAIDFNSSTYRDVFRNVYYREPVINLGNKRRKFR